MPSSPNWYRVQRKPVRTPIIRLHGAPTLGPPKRNQTITNENLLLIPEARIESPPPNRRRSFSLPPANKNHAGSSLRFLSHCDLRNLQSRGTDRRTSVTQISTPSPSNNTGRPRLRESNGIAQRNGDSFRRGRSAYLRDKFQHIDLIEARRTVSDQDVPTAVQANSIEESESESDESEDESEMQKSFIYSCETDSISVSSDEYALEVYPPSLLSQESIEVSPILFSRPL